MKVKKTVKFLILLWTLGSSQTSTAEVTSEYEGTNGRHLFILEDIHGHYPTQRIHLKTINHLSKKWNLSLIATEGASGYVSTVTIQGPSHASRHRLASSVHALLEKSRINAAHVLNAIAGNKYTVVGVENSALYNDHLALKENFSFNQKAALREWSRVERYARKNLNADMILAANRIQKIFRLKAPRSAFDGFNQLRFQILLTETENLKLNQSLLTNQLKMALNYYDLAFQRDRALAENILERMELEQEKCAALIVGGFHTKGITAVLRSKGISYTVFAPDNKD